MKSYIVIFLQTNLQKNKEGILQVQAHTFGEAETKALQIFSFPVEIIQITLYS